MSPSTSTSPSPDIDLALSGGGVRAMAFHAGVLKFLAEQQALERVRHISSVSGGSLLTGLIFHASSGQWPTSTAYLSTVLPAIEKTLTSKSLLVRAVARLVFNPLNWRFIVSRANVIAKAIKGTWGITECLADLPRTPEWSINAMAAETGRRFRFRNREFGDYEMGYAQADRFPLREALACSAAFPAGIGPMTIRCKRFKWTRSPSWNAPRESVSPPFKKLHVYDGGLYDNLGLEPLYDIGTRQLRKSGGIVIVADAGASLKPGFTAGPLDARRVKRWLDVTTEQQRALRIRCFVNALQQSVAAGKPLGAYLQIGTSAGEKLAELNLPTAHSIDWLSAVDATRAGSYRTSLRKMRATDFTRISRNGYETAHWNQLAYPYL